MLVGNIAMVRTVECIPAATPSQRPGAHANLVVKVCAPVEPGEACD